MNIIDLLLFREYPSKVYYESLNSKTRLSNIEPIQRKKSSKRPDILFSFGNRELGFAETAKIACEQGTKDMSDSAFKAPKIMKEMLKKLVDMKTTKVNSLCTICMVTSGKFIPWIHSNIILK